MNLLAQLGDYVNVGVNTISGRCQFILVDGSRAGGFRPIAMCSLSWMP
jgi:hypothetical protein